MAHYGFLGLGIMGRAMAINLIKAGYQLTVWNRSPEKCTELVEMGASRAVTPAEVAAEADVTFCMVSDPAASSDICFGEHGVLTTIGSGRGFIDVSTVGPDHSTKVYQAVRDRGGRYLEAPVSGSKKPAEDGALVFLCAGDQSLYTESEPALRVMGRKSYYFDEIGQGAKMKLLINMIMGTMMVAFSEGLTLGKKSGLQQDIILDVLQQGAIDTPMFRMKGKQMCNGDFSVAFPLKHMQKDMRLALQLADTLHQPLFSAAAANNCFLKSMLTGDGDLDFSAVLKAVDTSSFS